MRRVRSTNSPVCRAGAPLAFFLAALAIGASHVPVHDAPDNPSGFSIRNIVLFVADDHGQDMGAYGIRSVKDYIHRPEFELYDLRGDPWESENLAYLPEYVEVLAAYRGMLWDFEVRTSDPWLLKQEYE